MKLSSGKLLAIIGLIASMASVARADDDLPATMTVNQDIIPGAQGVFYVPNLGGDSSCSLHVSTKKPIHSGTVLTGLAGSSDLESSSADMTRNKRSGISFESQDRSVIASAECYKEESVLLPLPILVKRRNAVIEMAAPYFVIMPNSN